MLIRKKLTNKMYLYSILHITISQFISQFINSGQFSFRFAVFEYLFNLF